MIKFLATNPKTGRKILGFGLSEGNVERLKLDTPIKVNLSEMHPALDVDFVIIYGKTEQDMADILKEHGLITAETIVHVDPKLKEA